MSARSLTARDAAPGFYRVGQRRLRIVTRARVSTRWPPDPYRAEGGGVPYRQYAESGKTVVDRRGLAMPVADVRGWLPPNYEMGAACSPPRSVADGMRARARHLAAARARRG
jgi:hypothetical protein